jgi:hypothetical protein
MPALTRPYLSEYERNERKGKEEEHGAHSFLPPCLLTPATIEYYYLLRDDGEKDTHAYINTI